MFDRTNIRWSCALLLLAMLAPMSGAAQVTARWPLTRETRFGSETDTAATLVQPQIAAIGPTGEVLVFDYRTRQIKVYSQNGNFVRAIGRQGQGPGEFNRVLSMGFLADTVWTNDSQHRRITLFPPSGASAVVLDLVYTPARLPDIRALTTNALTAASPKAMLRGGLAVAQGTLVIADRSVQPAAFPSPIVLMRRNGAVIDTATSLDYRSRRDASIRVGSTSLSLAQPFQAEPFWAGHPDGSGFVTVDAPQVVTASTASFVVKWFDSTGKQTASRSYPYQPVRLAAHVRDSVLDAARTWLSARGAGAGAADSVRQMLTVPQWLPTITGLLFGRDGSVWIRREEFAIGGPHWSVLDSRGVVVATVTPPANAKMLYADMTHVLVVETDSNGENWVVRYRVGG